MSVMLVLKFMLAMYTLAHLLERESNKKDLMVKIHRTVKIHMMVKRVKSTKVSSLNSMMAIVHMDLDLNKFQLAMVNILEHLLLVNIR